MRTRTLLLSAALVTVVPVWLAGLAVGGSAPAGRAADAARPTSSASTAPAAERALAVLQAWDRRRADAWRRADPRALAALYFPHSRAGRRDVADLLRWRRRGLRVVGLRQQVLRLRLVRPGRIGPRWRDRASIVVLVTDRTVDGIAVGRGRRTPVPQSAWATQLVSLRRAAGSWRVVDAQARRSG